MAYFLYCGLTSHIISTNSHFLSFRISECRNNLGTLKVTRLLLHARRLLELQKITLVILLAILLFQHLLDTCFVYCHCHMSSLWYNHIFFYMIKLTASRVLVIFLSSINNTGSIVLTTGFPGFAPLSNWLNYLMTDAAYLSPKILIPSSSGICVKITCTDIL